MHTQRVPYTHYTHTLYSHTHTHTHTLSLYSHTHYTHTHTHARTYLGLEEIVHRTAAVCALSACLVLGGCEEKVLYLCVRRESVGGGKVGWGGQEGRMDKNSHSPPVMQNAPS